MTNDCSERVEIERSSIVEHVTENVEEQMRPEIDYSSMPKSYGKAGFRTTME